MVSDSKLEITGSAHTNGITLGSAVTSRRVSKLTQGSKGAARQQETLQVRGRRLLSTQKQEIGGD